MLKEEETEIKEANMGNNEIKEANMGNNEIKEANMGNNETKVKNTQPQPQPQVNSNTIKSKKRKEVFPFGNYRNYYGYRLDNDLDEDPRLKVLKKEWFENKDCLDIGCNSGIVTIQIAKKFQCRSILGIDIDSSRIENACWHLRKFARLETIEKTKDKKSKLAHGGEDNGLQCTVTSPSNEEKRKSLSHHSSYQESVLPEIVSFRQENFVQNQQLHEKRYDTILCLSVAKWIHLNWGDEGLITLFSKVWKLLPEGGIFVLEPQPWKSYESNRRVSETTAANFRNIEFRPDQFQDILLDKIGFRKVEDLTPSLSCSKSGFNRSIFAFHK